MRKGKAFGEDGGQVEEEQQEEEQEEEEEEEWRHECMPCTCNERGAK